PSAASSHLPVQQRVQVQLLGAMPEEAEERIVGEQYHLSSANAARKQPGGSLHPREVLLRNRSRGRPQFRRKMGDDLCPLPRLDYATARVEDERPLGFTVARRVPRQRMHAIEADLKDRPRYVFLPLLALTLLSGRKQSVERRCVVLIALG